jgi:hypothetical protein
MASYRDLTKERFWRRQVEAWQRSGLSIREFCSRNRLTETNFHNWRRQLAWRDQQPDNPRQEPATFVPVVVKPEQAGADGAIEIVLANGRSVRVRAGFDPDTLTQVMALLEGGQPC